MCQMKQAYVVGAIRVLTQDPLVVANTRLLNAYSSLAAKLTAGYRNVDDLVGRVVRCSKRTRHRNWSPLLLGPNWRMGREMTERDDRSFT